MKYGKGNTAPQSSVGTQFNESYYKKKALVERAKERFFGQLADKTIQPKHFGKEIKSYHYMPILDDRNINDEGIDANGVTISNGNLYGSSKDIGTIKDKLPTLTENGGRVNRVGMTRKTIIGGIAKFGYFIEYTKESMDFDTDAELKSHMTTEMAKASRELDEDMLQIDLHEAAGVVKYAGIATDESEITGEGDNISNFTYDGFRQLTKLLNANLCPKNTKIITGSGNTDTKTISAARYAYIDDDTRLMLEDLTDNFGNQAWSPTRMYAASGKIARGEVGSIDGLRFIEVPEKMIDFAKGAEVTDTDTKYQYSHSEADDKDHYDVHSILLIGSGAFTEVGFQAAGGNAKFTIKSKTPEENVTSLDPYGETGFQSIKWYYGSPVMRPEWIAKYLGVVK